MKDRRERVAIPARLRWLPRGLLLLALSGPTAARADDKTSLDVARAAFKEGAALAARRQWNAACDQYALSLRLHPAALTRYSLGVAQRAAGRLVSARASFEAFVAEPPSPTTRSYMEPARAAIAEIGGRVATLTLVLARGPVPRVEVTIDGVLVPAGSLAQRRAVDPGVHVIAARAPGRADTHATVTLAEGGAATLTLNLAPLPEGALSASSETPPASVAGPPAREQAPWSPELPIGLLVGGGAVLAGGVALGLVGFFDGQSAGSRVGPAADEARAKGIAGDVLAGTGAAAATLGLVLLLVQRSRADKGSARPWIVPVGAGVAVRF